MPIPENMLKAIQVNSDLEFLNLTHFDLDDNDVINLVKALENNTTITSIDLSHNRITSAGVESLTKLLATKPRITKLSLNDNQIDNKGIPLLANLSSLKRLELSQNKFSSVSIQSFANEKSKLDYLDLSNNKIAESDVIYLVENHPKLTKLILNDNKLTDSVVNALANRKLKSLSLADNKITGAGASELIQSTSLSVLDLSGNPIMSGTAKFENIGPNLESLNLSSTQINDEDVVKLAAHEHLRILYLGNNNIGDAGVEALNTIAIQLTDLELNNTSVSNSGASSLAQHPNLLHLNLSSTQIDNEGLAAFSKTQNLLTLDVSNNAIGNDGVVDLCKNESLEEVNLSDCHVGNMGIQELAKQPGLTTLYIRNNDFDDEGAKAFIGVKHIKTLDIDDNKKVSQKMLEQVYQQILENRVPTPTQVANQPLSKSESVSPPNLLKQATYKVAQFLTLGVLKKEKLKEKLPEELKEKVETQAAKFQDPRKPFSR